MYRNPVLPLIKTTSVETFTSDFGLKFRRLINPIYRHVLQLAISSKVHIVERYPLKKRTSYIFAATHSCIKNVIVNMAYIDRSSYMLVGTTDQIDHNPQMYAAWLNGIIYVNRMDPNSRKVSLDKMERVLRSGSSVTIFPEGGWNNSENLLVQPLFASPWLLAQRTGCEIVPIALRHEYRAKDIYIKFGAPMNFAGIEKNVALKTLRDALATMAYDLMEEYGTPLKRSDLGEDCRIDFMEERKNEYLLTKWSQDNWDEELTFYHDKKLPPSPLQVRASFDNVELTVHNALVIAPILKELEEDRKYDFTTYMHDNWQK